MSGGNGGFAEGADEVDGAGGEDKAVSGSKGTGQGKSFGWIVRGVSVNAEGAGRGEQVVERGGARVVDGRENDVVDLVQGSRFEVRGRSGSLRCAAG